VTATTAGKLGERHSQIYQQSRSNYRGERELFASTRRDWTPEEAESAFRTYFAFFGYYRVNTDTKEVVHITHADLQPSNVGVEKVRKYQFISDNRLVLTTPPFQLAADVNQWPEYLKPLSGGKEIYAEVKWRRVQ